jgi:MFS family permease
MRIEPYRRVLALPGVRSLMIVAILARVPLTAAGVTLTLHVVLDLGRGYAAAGLVGAASTVGSALGSPLLGRLVDRSGLRPALLVTTLAEVAFWGAAPWLPYPPLVVAAFVAGLLGLPVFGVVRQSLAALVPEAQRRQAYSLDSMSVELSFMIGPTVAVLVVTQLSATVAIWAVGAAMLLSGTALYLLNPPTREAAEGAPARRPARRDWLRPRLVGVLLVATAATVALSGTEVGVVALLRESDEVRWTGLVLAAWGAYSMAGGFVHGSMRRALPPVVLIALLGVFTVPVGLAHGWWLLCLVLLPAGALCAPTLAATADAVSRLVPAAARGEAMGWYGSGLTTGLALGAPFVGAVVDRSGPAWGFVAAGLAALAVALVALAVGRIGGGAGPAVEPGAEDPPAPGAATDLPAAAGIRLATQVPDETYARAEPVEALAA